MASSPAEPLPSARQDSTTKFSDAYKFEGNIGLARAIIANDFERREEPIYRDSPFLVNGNGDLQRCYDLYWPRVAKILCSLQGEFLEPAIDSCFQWENAEEVEEALPNAARHARKKEKTRAREKTPDPTDDSADNHDDDDNDDDDDDFPPKAASSRSASSSRPVRRNSRRVSRSLPQVDGPDDKRAVHPHETLPPVIYALVLSKTRDTFLTVADMQKIVTRVRQHLAKGPSRYLKSAVMQTAAHTWVESMQTLLDNKRAEAARNPDEDDSNVESSRAPTVVYVGYALVMENRLSSHDNIELLELKNMVLNYAQIALDDFAMDFFDYAVYEIFESSDIIAEHIISRLCHSYVNEGGLNATCGSKPQHTHTVNQITSAQFAKYAEDSSQPRIMLSRAKEELDWHHSIVVKLEIQEYRNRIEGLHRTRKRLEIQREIRAFESRIRALKM